LIPWDCCAPLPYIQNSSSKPLETSTGMG